MKSPPFQIRMATQFRRKVTYTAANEARVRISRMKTELVDTAIIARPLSKSGGNSLKNKKLCGDISHLNTNTVQSYGISPVQENYFVQISSL